MDEIAVNQAGPLLFSVTVTQRGRVTTHEVTVPAPALDKWGLADHDPADVVRESFEFLLEREPNTSILSRFDLPVIARYFPDYEEDLPRRLKR